VNQGQAVQTVRQTSIRPATADDTSYLFDAFEHALSPYYGGDHLAHAERLLQTHLSGGIDNRGLLSTRQLLLVLWEGAHRRGILNLVFKRQSTCKISPLILFPSNQDRRGLGTTLLRAAEAEARKAGARQLYCTVAQSNRSTLAFFLELGFAICGDAHEQYKAEETEILLRRPLSYPTLGSGKEDMISVAQVKDNEAWSEVRKLLAEGLPELIEGVSDAWLESMYDNARQFGDSSNDEGRRAWVYAAKDRSGEYRAAAIATYKKGGSLKIMPIAAHDLAAFRALILDLPTLLFGYGRKAYIHHAPSAAEVAVLQESAWTLEGLLPGAYREDVVTQQWGCALGKKDAPLQLLRIQNDYLAMIKRREKTLEIRVAYDHIKRIKPGDRIRLASASDQVVRRVRDVRSYPTLELMVDNEDIEQALPGLKSDEALERLREIYPPKKEELGIVVLDLV
jgi:ASC-1-like (ASCH) protein/GNAT superfamily N-acetyltransferase